MPSGRRSPTDTGSSALDTLYQEMDCTRVDAASLADVVDVPGSFSTGVFTTVGFEDIE